VVDGKKKARPKHKSTKNQSEFNFYTMLFRNVALRRQALRFMSTSPVKPTSSAPANPSSGPMLIEHASVSDVMKMSGKDRAEYVVVRLCRYYILERTHLCFFIQAKMDALSNWGRAGLLLKNQAQHQTNNPIVQVPCGP
jgi:hypothetical protein